MISKLLAAQKNGLKVPVKKRDVVLYLGASHGGTAKIMSGLVGPNGFVFCLNLSKVMLDLVRVCDDCDNMAPLLYDVSKPELYRKYVTKVDVVYQDVAQKNQVEIFKKNIGLFLKEYGYAVLVLDAKSTGITRDKEIILKLVLAELKKFLEVVDYVDLSPYHKEHYFIVCRKSK